MKYPRWIVGPLFFTFGIIAVGYSYFWLIQTINGK